MRGEGKVRVAVGLAAAVVALAVAGLAAAGCGETVIDTSKIESQTKSDLEQNLPKRLAAGAPGKQLQRELGIGPGEKVASVDCPRPEVVPGRTFSCSVSFANGRRATETFRIVNDKADVEEVAFGPAK
jgi:hypothetical protein